MADILSNIAMGATRRRVDLAAANGIVALMTAAEADATLRDRTDFADLFAEAGNTEAVDASAARKTGVTFTVTQDDVNDRVDLDMPDQTFTALAGAAIVKALIGYEDAAAEATRVPFVVPDFAVTPDGSDVTLQVNAAGFLRLEQAP